MIKGQIISRIHLLCPMHTNWCVLIEISMEIGILNFWNMIICLCNGAWNSLYWCFQKEKKTTMKIDFAKISSKTGQEIHKNWQCAMLAHIQRKFVNLKLLSFVESIKCIFWSIFHCESAQKTEWVHPQHSGWFWQEFLNPWQDDTSNK